MVGQARHRSHRAIAWATGLSLAAALIGARAAAQQVAPPPPPRLPPVPALPLFGPAAQAPSFSRRCSEADWTCRIDALERRVAELEHELDRGGRGDGRRGRSTDMTVDRDCIFDSCTAMASKLCAEAGFTRGVPAEVRQNGSWQRLVRATCLD